VGCCYAAGAFSFWSVLVLFLGNDNNGVVFSLGSVPRWYQQSRTRDAESRANETPQQRQTRLQIAGFEIL
jgi:hypothetical protein